MCSTGDLSYGSWSAECCEYLASLSWVWRDTVPSTGERAPVMRFNRVDLPVPLSPTMAILPVSMSFRNKVEMIHE